MDRGCDNHRVPGSDDDEDLPIAGVNPGEPASGTVRQGRIRNQVATTFGANLLLQGLGVLTAILAARLLGPAGNGELATVRTWAGTLGMISALGLMDALVYRVAREPKRSGQWLATARVLYAVTGSAGAIVGLLLVPRVLGGQDPVVQQTAMVFLLTIPLEALCWTWIHPLRSIGRFTAWNVMRLAPTTIWLGVLLAGWAGGAPTTAALITWYVAAYALVGGVLSVAVLGWFTRPRSFSRGQVRPLFSFGLPALAAGLPQMLNARVDLLAVSALMATYDTGLYAVGLSASAMVGLGAGAVGAVIFPRVAQQQTADGGRTMVVRASRISVAPTALVTAAAAVTVALLIPVIYGEDYRSAVLAGVILCVAAGVAAFSMVLGEGLRGLGKQAGLVVAYTVGALVTGGGIVALAVTEHLTIESAAVVTGAANLVSLSILLVFGQRACDTSWVHFVTPLVPGGTVSQLRRLGGSRRSG